MQKVELSLILAGVPAHELHPQQPLALLVLVCGVSKVNGDLKCKQ